MADTLAAVESLSIAGSTGITTFIKDELVGDGGRRPAVTPPVKFGRTAAETGLRRGRKFDAEFQAAIKGTKCATATVTKAVQALYANGVHPIKCQHRVLTDNKLTTLIDCIGIQTSAPFAPVSIELKTCQMPIAKYDSYSLMQCRRTPMLRCSPALPNTERSRHCLQAAYGAVALQPLFSLKVQAVVLVLCPDGVVVYPVPKRYFCGTLFVRLTPIFRPKQRNRFKVKRAPVIVFEKWGPAVCKAARKHGLSLARSYKPNNVRTVVRGNYAVGVAVYMPAWHTMQPAAKAAAITRLQTACKTRHTGYVKMPQMSLLVVTSHPGTDRIHIVMASKPFCLK